MGGKLYLIFLISLILVFSVTIFEMPVKASSRMSSVHYQARTYNSDVEFLSILLNYEWEKNNNYNLSFNYDGSDINLGASWLMEFIQENNYKLKLGLSLASEFEGGSIGKAIVLAGDVDYLTNNKFFWDLKYYFDEKEWTYCGGVGLPVAEKTSLTFSFSKHYWERDNTLLNVGIKVEI